MLKTEKIAAKTYYIKGIEIPERDPKAHKGDFGRLLIMAGSPDFTGAPSLAARAALRAGAGLVYLAVPESIYQIEAAKNDEAMVLSVPADANGLTDPAAVKKLAPHIEKASCVLAGPGMGRGGGLDLVLRDALSLARCPVVLDADALFAAAEDPGLIWDNARRIPMILTPHEGEFKRLISGRGYTFTPGDDYSRIACARRFVRETGTYLILKGRATVVALPDETCFINTTGGPALAKGGSGDVLAGILSALICQFPLVDGLCGAVYIHGMAGDHCSHSLSQISVLASDVVESLPYAFSSLMKRSDLNT